MKTFKGAYITLLKTSIGSGVLNFPLLFRNYGIAAAICLTIVSGFFASVGLLLLAICAQEVGRSADLSSLASLSIPHARPVVDISVFVKCFGVSLSYMIIAKQLLPPFIEAVLGDVSILKKSWLPLFLFLLLVAPFTYIQRLDRLKYTSFLGVICIILVIFCSGYRFFFQTAHIASINWIAPLSLNWLSGLGKFVFSFTCHQNIFAANSELKDNSLKTMRKLIYSVASTAFFLYLSFGMFNYLLYGDSVKDNALNNYPSDYLAAVARGMYIIVMGVSYPLQVVPARKYLINMMRINPDSRYHKLSTIAVTTLLLVSTYAIAISNVELGTVYALVGATASTFMCLILPSLYYLNMEIERSVSLIVAGYCAFLFGVLVFTATIFGILLSTHKS